MAGSQFVLRDWMLQRSGPDSAERHYGFLFHQHRCAVGDHGGSAQCSCYFMLVLFFRYRSRLKWDTYQTCHCAPSFAPSFPFACKVEKNSVCRELLQNHFPNTCLGSDVFELLKSKPKGENWCPRKLKLAQYFWCQAHSQECLQLDWPQFSLFPGHVPII